MNTITLIEHEKRPNFDYTASRKGQKQEQEIAKMSINELQRENHIMPQSYQDCALTS